MIKGLVRLAKDQNIGANPKLDKRKHTKKTNNVIIIYQKLYYELYSIGELRLYKIIWISNSNKEKEKLIFETVNIVFYAVTS
jgi:hypothetical protein